MKVHLAVFCAVPCMLSGRLHADLVTHFAFDGNAIDSSGHGNDGSVHGATLATDRFGNPGMAYAFNGTGDHITASASLLPTAERTVALWFNCETVASRPGFLGYGGSGQCGTSFFCGLNIDGSHGYYVSSHCEVHTLIAPYGERPTGTWMHFALTTSAAGTRIYVNGQLAAENGDFIANTAAAGTTLSIGVIVSTTGSAPYTDSNVGYFQGAIDDVRIYDTALTQAQIQGLMTPCIGDLDSNGMVDGADLGTLLGAWGSADAAADLNADSTVDGGDLGILLAAWGACS